jgi:hypothetical protein
MAEGFLSGVGSDPAVPRKVTFSIFSLVRVIGAETHVFTYHLLHRHTARRHRRVLENAKKAGRSKIVRTDGLLADQYKRRTTGIDGGIMERWHPFRATIIVVCII